MQPAPVGRTGLAYGVLQPLSRLIHEKFIQERRSVGAVGMLRGAVEKSARFKATLVYGRVHHLDSHV